MEAITEALSVTSTTGWVISLLLGFVVFFLRRLLKSFDKMENTVSQIGNAIVEHRTIVDGHEDRIGRIEEKVFPTK